MARFIDEITRQNTVAVAWKCVPLEELTEFRVERCEFVGLAKRVIGKPKSQQGHVELPGTLFCGIEVSR